MQIVSANLTTACKSSYRCKGNMFDECLIMESIISSFLLVHERNNDSAVSILDKMFRFMGFIQALKLTKLTNCSWSMA